MDANSAITKGGNKMKKVRIPFSLNEYNKGSYEVETRGDKYTKPKKVRIICTNRKEKIYPIVALIESNGIEDTLTFTLDGCNYANDQKTKCNLFLVKQEFEDGDIVIREGNDVFGPFILPYRGTNEEGGILTEVYLDCFTDTLYIKKGIDYGCTRNYRLATEEEKKKFFDALTKKCKKWDAETKQIEDIKPKCTLQPFDKVLTRNSDSSNWQINLFCSYNKNVNCKYTCFLLAFRQCIPYNNETKNLLGTTEDAPEKYKTW